MLKPSLRAGCAGFDYGTGSKPSLESSMSEASLRSSSTVYVGRRGAAQYAECFFGCPSGIRTPICCSRGSCPTIERRGNARGMARLAARLAGTRAGRPRLLTTLIIIGGFPIMVKPCPPAVVSQFESGDWEADLWSLVSPATRRADSVQPHLRATSAQAILKNVGGDFAAWQNLSTD